MPETNIQANGVEYCVAFFNKGEISMGMSKSDLTRKRNSIKQRLDELEKQAFNDPLKKNRKLHEEIDELKKKLESC